MRDRLAGLVLEPSGYPGDKQPHHDSAPKMKRKSLMAPKSASPDAASDIRKTVNRVIPVASLKTASVPSGSRA